MAEACQAEAKCGSCIAAAAAAVAGLSQCVGPRFQARPVVSSYNLRPVSSSWSIDGSVQVGRGSGSNGPGKCHCQCAGVLVLPGVFRLNWKPDSRSQLVVLALLIDVTRTLAKALSGHRARTPFRFRK